MMRTPKHDHHESTLVDLCWQADVALYWVSPTYEADLRRTAVFEFIRDVLLSQKNLRKCHVMLTGSFSAKTYLPNADIDISIQTSNDDDVCSDDLMFFVNDALCRAAVKSGTHSPRIGSASTVDDDRVVQKYPIRHITFINGRVKVVSCVVGNIYVDISVCAPSGSLAAAVLMEEVDRHLLILDPPRYLRNVWGTSAQRHIFKRSVLLIKAWCLYESGPLSAAVGGLEDLPILCSKTGRLSSYAISVMVMALFNESRVERGKYQTMSKNSLSFISLNGVDTQVCGGDSISADLSHPFLVLLRFLRVYSCFDWQSFALSVDGPVPLSQLSSNRLKDNGSQSIDQNPQKRPLADILSKIKKKCSADVFPVKAWNIIDPLDSGNNLTMGVSKGASRAIHMAIDMGRRHMDDIIHHLTLTASSNSRGLSVAWTPPSRSNLEFVTSFFPALTDTYGCFSQSGNTVGHEVVAVPYGHHHLDETSVDVVSSPPLGSYKSEIGHRLWLLVQESWPCLPNELVNKVTGMLLENSSELLLPVMDDRQRLVPLVAHALAALGCEGVEGFPGVVFIVAGNGYRSDLCDHPMQRTIAFTRRRRRQRGRNGATVIVEEGGFVGYDLYGTELDCDLDRMKYDLELACSPMKQAEVKKHHVSSPSDFDTFQLDDSSPSICSSPPKPTVIEASPVKPQITSSTPVKSQKISIEPSPVKPQITSNTSPRLNGRQKKSQSKHTHKPQSSKGRTAKDNVGRWQKLPASLLTSVAVILSASAFYLYIFQIKTTSGAVSVGGTYVLNPVYDMLSKVININMTGQSEVSYARPTSITHASSNSCDDSCAHMSTAAPSSLCPVAPTCDTSITRMWVLQGRDTILGDLIHSQNNLVYKWEKNNHTVGVVTPFLIISNVSIHDEGLYTCFARNLTLPNQKRGSLQPSSSNPSKRKKSKRPRRSTPSMVDASVTGLGEINSFEFVELFSMHLMMAVLPAVEHKLETWDLIEGSSLLLEVTATGAPTPHCYWRFNGQKLAAGNFFGASVYFRDSSGGKNSVLEVVSVAEDHSGTYTCVCENAVGSVRWEEALVTVRPRGNVHSPHDTV